MLRLTRMLLGFFVMHIHRCGLISMLVLCIAKVQRVQLLLELYLIMTRDCLAGSVTRLTSVLFEVLYAWNTLWNTINGGGHSVDLPIASLYPLTVKSVIFVLSRIPLILIGRWSAKCINLLQRTLI